MPEGLHLEDRHLRILLTLIEENLPGVEVWAYGSRTNGRSHDGSDLDLVLRGPGLQAISFDQKRQFKHALSESMIPILVDVMDWASVPERIRQEIARNFVVVVEEG